MTLQEINEINRKAIASDYLDMRTRVSRRNTLSEISNLINNWFGIPQLRITESFCNMTGNGVICKKAIIWNF